MRGIADATKALIAEVNAILRENNPQTLRQVHYQVFSRGNVENYKNDKACYRKLSRVLTDARRLFREAQLAGSRPPKDSVTSDWISDELRQGESVSMWDSAGKFFETVRRAYRRNNWQDQPYYVEVWGEKAAVAGSLRPIMDKFGVVIRVCRGFGSAGMEDQVGREFEEIDEEIVVLYVGDHDPSGRLIGEDMHRRVEKASGREFEMRRLAVNEEDIAAFNLPPQQIKDSDTRAVTFREEHGDVTVELEALPVAELNRRITEAIDGLIDRDKWDRQIEKQDREMESIKSVVDDFESLEEDEADDDDDDQEEDNEDEN